MKIVTIILNVDVSQSQPYNLSFVGRLLLCLRSNINVSAWGGLLQS